MAGGTVVVKLFWTHQSVVELRSMAPLLRDALMH
jgi:hypothetical protein